MSFDLKRKEIIKDIVKISALMSLGAFSYHVGSQIGLKKYFNSDDYHKCYARAIASFENWNYCKEIQSGGKIDEGQKNMLKESLKEIVEAIDNSEKFNLYFLQNKK